MSLFSYKPLITYIEERGYTVNALKLKKVITDNAAQNIRNGRPVTIDHIANICRYFNVPIQEIIEIKYEDESTESD